MNKLEGAIRLSRSVEYMFWGLGGMMIVLSFDRLLSLSPFTTLRYLHLFPLAVFFAGALDLPMDAFPGRDWEGACRRLKYCAVFLLGLAPFWVWWHSAPENMYFKINNAIFLCTASLTLFNIAGLSVAASEAKDRRLVRFLGKMTRLATIYLCFGPVCAFFIADLMLLGKKNGHDIFIFAENMANWKLYLVEAPAMMALLLLLFLRDTRPANCPASDKENMNEIKKTDSPA